MAIVTLEQIKLHVRVDHTDEDAILTRLIDAAQNKIERSLGYAIAAEFGGEEQEDIPPALVEAVCQLAGHWYANREASDGGTALLPIPYGVDEIIRDFRDWSWCP